MQRAASVRYPQAESVADARRFRAYTCLLLLAAPYQSRPPETTRADRAPLTTSTSRSMLKPRSRLVRHRALAPCLLSPAISVANNSECGCSASHEGVRPHYFPQAHRWQESVPSCLHRYAVTTLPCLLPQPQKFCRECMMRLFVQGIANQMLWRCSSTRSSRYVEQGGLGVCPLSPNSMRYVLYEFLRALVAQARPMTHDFMKLALDTLGYRVSTA